MPALPGTPTLKHFLPPTRQHQPQASLSVPVGAWHSSSPGQVGLGVPSPRSGVPGGGGGGMRGGPITTSPTSLQGQLNCDVFYTSENKGYFFRAPASPPLKEKTGYWGGGAVPTAPHCQRAHVWQRPRVLPCPHGALGPAQRPLCAPRAPRAAQPRGRPANPRAGGISGGGLRAWIWGGGSQGWASCY